MDRPISLSNGARDSLLDPIRDMPNSVSVKVETHRVITTSIVMFPW